MNLLLLFIFAYFLGAVPFAVIICRSHGIDILKIGSGNPGMTNVTRVMGKGWGITCFVLDVFKGLIPSVIAHWVVPTKLGVFDAQFVWFCVGLTAVIGHCLSPFLRFKGGKGISTSLGAIIGSSPIVAALCFGLFGIIFLITRYVSVASVVGVTSVLLFSLIVPNQTNQLLPIFAILAAFIAWRHRKNFQRVREGTEPKFSLKKTIDAQKSEDAEKQPQIAKPLTTEKPSEDVALS